MGALLRSQRYLGRPAVPAGAVRMQTGMNRAGEHFERHYHRGANRTYLFVHRSGATWDGYEYAGNVAPSCCR